MDKYGCCTLCVVPVRAEMDDRSEMTTQLLFGESYRILNSSPKWFQIEINNDGYTGYIDRKQHNNLTKSQYNKLTSAPLHIAYELVYQANILDHKQVLLMGSNLPYFDGMNFRLNNIKGVYTGRALEPRVERNHPHLLKIARKYLNTPYLWGGRSPFGIDCSGFVQVVYKFVDHKLKRDTYQQLEEGRLVNMLSEAREGDLAFFRNGENRVNHVGILIDKENIIHASGKVRIDKIDNFGIFNGDIDEYTHQLHAIKRLL